MFLVFLTKTGNPAFKICHHNEGGRSDGTLDQSRWRHSCFNDASARNRFGSVKDSYELSLRILYQKEHYVASLPQSYVSNPIYCPKIAGKHFKYSLGVQLYPPFFYEASPQLKHFCQLISRLQGRFLLLCFPFFPRCGTRAAKCSRVHFSRLSYGNIFGIPPTPELR